MGAAAVGHLVTRRRFGLIQWMLARVGRRATRVGGDLLILDATTPPATRQERYREWLQGPHLCDLFERLGVDLVLDVGANTGGFAAQLRRAGWKGPIASFEPQSAARERLSRRAAGDPAWQVLPCALSDREGTVELVVRGASELTSLQAPRLESRIAAHLQDPAALREVGVETVPLRRLDTILPELAGGGARRIFLKIDTQGHDERVLAGASGMLDRVVGIQLELTQDPLYHGTRTWIEVCSILVRLGFGLNAIWPVFVDPEANLPLEFDGVFVRRDAAPA